jgi:hypothetical protein
MLTFSRTVLEPLSPQTIPSIANNLLHRLQLRGHLLVGDYNVVKSIRDFPFPPVQPPGRRPEKSPSPIVCKAASITRKSEDAPFVRTPRCPLLFTFVLGFQLDSQLLDWSQFVSWLIPKYGQSFFLLNLDFRSDNAGLYIGGSSSGIPMKPLAPNYCSERLQKALGNL